MDILGPITHLTIHCAATPEGKNIAANDISQWDRVKFGQVSYHYVIKLDGTCINTLDIKWKGAHVHLHNTGNIGVCYVGGIDIHGNPKDTRTEAQKEALRTIVQKYRNLYPKIIILGHRDWPEVHKACPSFDVKTAL